MSALISPSILSTRINQFNYYKYLSGLLAGGLLPLAFSPYDLYLFAIISPFLLLFLWEKSSPFQALITGFFYGLGFFGIGVSWVFLSIHNYGNSNIFAAGSLTFLFVALLALFPALTGYVLQKFFSKKEFIFSIRYLIILPCLWALCDALRSIFLTGFPWLLLGYSQTHSPLRGFAPITGVYGLSFILIFCAGLLKYIFSLPSKTQKNILYKYINIIILILIFYSGFLLTKISWTTPVSKPVNIRLIQGNIPITLKWSPQYAYKTLILYEHLSLLAPDSLPVLTIWPETAIPFFWPDAQSLLSAFNNLAKKNHQIIITGIPITKNYHYYNGAIMLGTGSGEYLKRHLVPFGEYTPFEYWLGKLLSFLNLPLSTLQAGPEHQPLMSAFGLNIAPLICYEIAYTNLLRTDLPDANVWIVLSNDSWFGESSALGQHRQMAQFAALITGRYVLVSTNSGETVVINPQGNIIQALPINTVSALTSTITGMSGMTPWAKVGNNFYLFLFFIILSGLKIFRVIIIKQKKLS